MGKTEMGVVAAVAGRGSVPVVARVSRVLVSWHSFLAADRAATTGGLYAWLLALC